MNTFQKFCWLGVFILAIIATSGCAALEIGSLMCSAAQGQPCSVSLKGQE